MAEETTNNQAPLTARQVAEQNPELNKLREIAFGTSYLDDIDNKTGTARFYSGFGQQPTYMGSNIDQTIADAVTSQAQDVAAPIQDSSNINQAAGGGGTGISGIPDNSMYGGDFDQGGLGDGITNYEYTPGETLEQQQAIDQSIQNLGSNYNIYNPAESGEGITNYDYTPNETAEQQRDIQNAITGLGDQYDIYSPTEYPEIGLDSEFIDQAAEDQKLDNLKIGQTSMIDPYGIDSKTYDELSGEGITKYKSTPEVKSAWEKVKGFAGKLFEGIGDTKSQEEYNSYSDEQKATIDKAYAPGGTMEGYNAVSGFGQGVQSTIQDRIDTIDKANTGTEAAAAKREDLQDLLNTLDTSTPVGVVERANIDDTDPYDIGFTSAADEAFEETGDYDVYSGGDTGTTSSPTPAGDYSYAGSDEEDEASNYASEPESTYQGSPAYSGSDDSSNDSSPSSSDSYNDEGAYWAEGGIVRLRKNKFKNAK